MSLEGKVAVVTGASRGAGRGIALALGEAGATVYVTGRSTRASPTRPDLAGTTVEDTAAQVCKRGGVGIAVQVDHTQDPQVAALFGRVREEQGRIDILVNNAWGGYENYHPQSFDAPFWEQPVERFDRMLLAGVRSSFVAGQHAARMMIKQGRGLIVNTTLNVGVNDWNLDQHGLLVVPYEVSKTAINRMAFSMAHNLRTYNVAAVALAPDWMRTEEVMHNYPPKPEEYRLTESTQLIGRAVVALATDPNLMSKTGRLLRTRDLALEYGFTDIDGRQPE
ncbi:MAG: oxidoreductase [Meiothermus sp.]